MSDVLQIILAVVGGLFAGGSIPVLFFRQTRKKLQTENIAAEVQEWQRLYNETKDEGHKKDELIADLYHRLDDARKYSGSLEVQLARLKAVVAYLKVIKCYIFNCGNRQPPIKEITNFIGMDEADDVIQMNNEGEENGTKQNDN